MILVVEQRSNPGLGKVKSRSNLGVGRCTYSEAMLISGASKQISSAILYYFRFYNLLKILSSRHHYIPGDEPKNWLRFIIHNGCITDVIAVISDYLFLFQFLLLWHIHNSGYNQGKRRCYKNEPVSLKTIADVTN